LFNFESIRTSGVFIIFSANFFNSFTARGARFLNALFQTPIIHRYEQNDTYMPCNRLCKLTVYSRVTTSFVICFLLLPLSPFFVLVFAIVDQIFDLKKKKINDEHFRINNQRNILEINTINEKKDL
jgi:hypothetical protein